MQENVRQSLRIFVIIVEAGLYRQQLSHDLRNPMGVLSLGLAMLEQDIAGPRRGDMITRARRALSRMERLIEDLLDVARIDSGTLQIGSLAKGMYTLSVSDGQKVFHQRFVKE